MRHFTLRPAITGGSLIVLLSLRFIVAFMALQHLFISSLCMGVLLGIRMNELFFELNLC